MDDDAMPRRPSTTVRGGAALTSGFSDDPALPLPPIAPASPPKL
jgi:hypothetical protein